MAATVDVSGWIEQQKVSRTQILVMVLMTLAAAVEGIDAQMIGYVAPAVIRQFKVPPYEFTSVFAIGLTGLLVGCLAIAPLGDWVGRKRVLLGRFIFFGVMSLLTAWADSLQSLSVLRFLPGLGLGGSMPNAIALTSEYFPSRNRTFTPMSMWSGVRVLWYPSAHIGCGRGRKASRIPSRARTEEVCASKNHGCASSH